MKTTLKAAIVAALRLGPLWLALLAWALAPQIWTWISHQDPFAATIATRAKSDEVWPFARLVGPLLVLVAMVFFLKQNVASRRAVYSAMAGVVLTAIASLGTGEQADWVIGQYGTWPLGMILSRLVLAHPGIPIVGVFSIAVAAALLGPPPAPPVVPIRRAPSANHGRADWLDMDAARQRFSGPTEAYGGIVVGEAYRVDLDPGAAAPFDPQDPETWGQGGRSPLLIDPCWTGSTHGLVIAGSGAFKTTSIAIPTLLTWTGSVVVLDPSREMGPMVSRYRQSTMGHRVVTLDPANPAGGSINVLAWIDPASPLAETNVDDIVAWISGETSGGHADRSRSDFFPDQGRTLIACIIADLVWDKSVPAEERTLRRVRQILVTPEHAMRTILQRIHERSHSPMARQLAGTLMGLVDETFSGVYGNATKQTRFLSVEAYADLVSGSGFQPAELCAGKSTVFVQIPMEILAATPALGRLVIGALLNAVYRADGAVAGRVLFLCDEARRLGYMSALETARDAGRKYRITLCLLYQSVGQLVEQWGEHGKRAWYDSTSWRMFAGVQDPDIAAEVSRMCGEHGVMTRSRGDTSGTSTQRQGGSTSTGRSETDAEQARALIKADELLQTVRADEAIVIMAGRRPLRCGRAIFFRRPAMQALVDGSRFE